MPYKNKQKELVKNGIYHAYNRGLEKRTIFLDSLDYKKFIQLINEYQNIHAKKMVSIFAYCLMPNHFHFLVQQKNDMDMPRFIQVITGEYTRYFNWRYRREGQLWQGTYKAKRIKDESQFNHVLNYIHMNPIEITEHINNYRFSSLKSYVYMTDHPFLKKGRPYLEATGSRL